MLWYCLNIISCVQCIRVLHKIILLRFIASSNYFILFLEHCWFWSWGGSTVQQRHGNQTMSPTSHQGNICNYKWRWHHQEICAPLHKWKSYPGCIYTCSFFDAHLERCHKRMLERARCGLRQHVGIKFHKIWIVATSIGWRWWRNP